MSLEQRFPSVSFMERAARRRVPKFAYDYLTGGIGQELCLRRNREALDAVQFMPRYICDLDTPDMRTDIFGHTFDAPFGVAPMGLGGLIWPRSAEILARASRQHNIPFTLSTFATVSLETIRKIADEQAWFQLYVPNDVELETAVIDRAAAAGYEVLMVTVDVPGYTPRERDIANGLSVPPRFNARTVSHIAARPSWAMATLAAGVPQFETLMPYVSTSSGMQEAAKFLSGLIEGHVTHDTLKRIRDRWAGKLIVKGVLGADDARQCKAIGADGVVVSNHGGRQLDAAPSAIDVIAGVREACGPDMVLLADGGARTGLDVARLLAKGADLVLMGRAFMFAVAAMGSGGGDHVMEMLKRELRTTMGQLGCADVASLPKFLQD
jgi:L-lactate dehydrogenase (cytochrome)